MGSDRNVARQIELNVTGMSFIGTSFPSLFGFELPQLCGKANTYNSFSMCICIKFLSTKRQLPI
jgi:hypothetical protein